MFQTAFLSSIQYVQQNKYKTIQPINPPSAERRNDCQAQYFPNADKPPIKTGHVPMPYHLNFRRPFGCQNLLGTISAPYP